MKYISLIIILFLSGCVSTSTHEQAERNTEAQKNSAEKIANLEKEVELLRKAESGALAKEFTDLKQTFNYFVQESELGRAAQEYLVSEGWRIVQVVGTVNIKKSEYDYAETECIVISGAGITGKAIAYERGILGSFLFINKGKALAKTRVFGIEIIDTNGRVQNLSEFKALY